MKKRLTLTGSTLRDRPIDEKIRLAAGLRNTIWPLFEKGIAKPVVFQTFDLSKADEAHAALDSGEHIGKIVLTVD